jgi:hypothetical protein
MINMAFQTSETNYLERAALWFAALLKFDVENPEKYAS